jgi:agmatinase
MGGVNPSCFAQLGIRSAAERAARGHLRDQDGQILTAPDLRGLDNPTQT